MARKHQFVLVGVFWILLSAVTFGYAFGQQPQLVIRWSTETEVDTAGFYLNRAASPDGPFERVSSTLIAGAGDPLAGADYEFFDDGVEAGRRYYYQLEEVEYNGNVNRTELLMAAVPARPWWVIGLGGFGLIVGIVLLVTGLRP